MTGTPAREPRRYDRTLRVVMWMDAFLSFAFAGVAMIASPVVAALGLPHRILFGLGVTAIALSVLLAALGAITGIALMARMRAGDYLLPADLHLPLPAGMRRASRRPLRAADYPDRMAAETVDVRTAREMQRAGDVIIDVRTPAEFAHEHIAGAINIPIDQLVSGNLPPGQLITTCSTGRRGGRAADQLTTAGRSAFSIAGGTKAWAAAGLPIVTRRR